MINALEVNNLNKSFKNFSLKDISFNIAPGSIMGLIGENGSGKTTIIKCILDIVKKDSGQVYYFGKDFSNFELSIKENISAVLDGEFFHENLSAMEVSRILKNLYPTWDEEKYFSYLEKFQLPKEQIIKEYSKGMLIKLSVSAALSHRSKLIILDEPTSGLDPITRLEILDELLNFIQDEECSILFSTHITSDLDKIADYITFIHNGSVVFSKDREELLTNYGIIRTSLEDFSKIPRELILKVIKNRFNISVLIKDKYSLKGDFIVDNTSTEDIMLFFIKGENI